MSHTVKSTSHEQTIVNEIISQAQNRTNISEDRGLMTIVSIYEKPNINLNPMHNN